MKQPTTIKANQLSHVTGGDSTSATPGGANTANGQLGVQVPLGKSGQSINVGGTFGESTTNYTQCLRTVAGLPGASADTIKSACGLPPSGN
jgi:hypothetical protein